MEIKSKGVEVSASITCATELGVVDELTELGLELKPWRQPLTELTKSDAKLITI